MGMYVCVSKSDPTPAPRTSPWSHPYPTADLGQAQGSASPPGSEADCFTGNSSLSPPILLESPLQASMPTLDLPSALSHMWPYYSSPQGRAFGWASCSCQRKYPYSRASIIGEASELGLGSLWLPLCHSRVEKALRRNRGVWATSQNIGTAVRSHPEAR